MKNRHYTVKTLPAGIRTRSSRKLAGSKANKPRYNVKKKNRLESWDKSQCGCGGLTAACSIWKNIYRWDRYEMRKAAQQLSVYANMDRLGEICREMPTRRCPLTGCVDLPCARFQSSDENRWYLDNLVWESRYRARLG